jgi:uncharacterized membrane protein
MADELERPEGALAPPTEQIHLPGPSYLAPVMAFGITLIVTGVVLSPIFVAIGVITFLITLVKWIRQTREEMRELPLEH